jgi:hypothetical protein
MIAIIFFLVPICSSANDKLEVLNTTFIRIKMCHYLNLKPGYGKHLHSILVAKIAIFWTQGLATDEPGLL